MFDIRDYMWEIFCLSQTEDVHNVRLALDLFLVNVELGEDRYEGADVDYDKIMHKYLKLSENEKELQKEEFNAILNIAYKKLCTYWHDHDKKDFELCAHDDDLHSEELDHIQEELHKIAIAKEKRKRRKNKKKKNKKAPRIKKF